MIESYSACVALQDQPLSIREGAGHPPRRMPAAPPTPSPGSRPPTSSSATSTRTSPPCPPAPWPSGWPSCSTPPTCSWSAATSRAGTPLDRTRAGPLPWGRKRPGSGGNPRPHPATQLQATRQGAVHPDSHFLFFFQIFALCQHFLFFVYDEGNKKRICLKRVLSFAQL